MMTFDAIATALLEEYGYNVLECASDEEAIDKAEELKNGGRDYPVHYSGSNTSGEKAFEEFFTDEENVDMIRFESLGVITDKEIPDVHKIEVIMSELGAAFERLDLTKEEIVDIIKN